MASVTNRAVTAVARRPRIVALAALVLLALLAGAGEAAAHNPADIAVPGCENGADVVAEQNQNCHA